MSDAEVSLGRRGEGLSGEQQTALGALRGGGTFVRAAEEAGVSRMTLYRWLRGNPQFRAAFNAWQEEAIESARTRLIKLADQAVDVVEHALSYKDEKVALKVLRSVGALRKRNAGSIDPNVLELQMQLRDKQELRQAEMAMLEHLMEKAGMGAEQRKSVLAGGPAAAKIVEAVRQESARGAQPEHRKPIEMGGSEAVAGSVTSEEPATASAGKELDHVEAYKCMSDTQLEMEISAIRDLLSDVTQGVTPDGA